MKRWILSLLCGLVTATAAATATAQDYPTKPIKLLVPFAAGGPTDATARALAQGLGPLLGQTIFVENRAGAGSTVGADMVAKASPDGYTLLFATASIAINATLYPKLPYNTLTDLTPIAQVANTYLVLVTRPDVPHGDLKQFIGAVKANPDKFTFGSAGVGSGLQLAAELLHSMNGIKGVTHVPYRGNSQVVPALLSGEVTYAFLGMDSAVPHIRSGKVAALAVTTPKRDPALPDVPSFAELGLPGFEPSVWFMVLAPKGTPPALVRKLNLAINKVIESPEIAEMARNFAGMVLMKGSTPESTVAFLRDEVNRWGPVVRASGAQAE
jgi:tripartite-type tricarboxylate transporter receptor subunit TctC